MANIHRFGGTSLPDGNALGNAWFVDGKNGSDLEDGKSWAKAKKTISSAVESSIPDQNDHIFVKEGVYTEEIIIDKNAIHLIGMSPSFCQLSNLDKPILQIKADAVEITGFTIKINGSFHGITSTVSFNHCTIHDNIILGDDICFGIVLAMGSSFNEVFNNKFITSGLNIYLAGDEDSQCNVVRDNLILRGQKGVYFCGAKDVYNEYHVVRNNVICNHNKVGCVGIDISRKEIRNNLITQNILCGNFMNIRDKGTNNNIIDNTEI